MHSISKFITNEYLIEKTAWTKNIWKKWILKLEINHTSNAREDHFKKIENIAKMSNTAIFYTNAAYNSKKEVFIASCILYHKSRIACKTWNLEVEMSINDAKLYAIEQAVKWSKTLQSSTHIWIFTDSQNAIQCIEKSTHFLANEI
jgi:hypothetical protein